MREPIPVFLLLSLVSLAACQSPATDTSSEAALIAKARTIHASILTLDTHKDINPTLALGTKSTDPKKIKAWRQMNDPTVDGSNKVDFPKMREGGYDCAFYIVYVGQGRLDGGGYLMAKKAALLKFDAIDRMVNKYPEHIGLARTPDDVRRLHAAGKLIACIGIENGYPMGLDLSLIEEFHRRGARYMSIAHNRHSQLGDSHTPKKPLHNGLSELGRKAVAEMNRVGIMVDISHSSKQTMLQVLEASQAPVIASHSGCADVRAHTRNIDDEQLLALGKNGGVIQCVALGSFVKDTSARRDAVDALRKKMGAPTRQDMWNYSQGGGVPDNVKKVVDAFEAKVKTDIDPSFRPANVADFVDHIDHAVKLIGVEHVAISSDFDGGGGVEGWNNARETFNVTLELVRRGYTKAQIAALWSGNTLRLWSEVEAVSKRIQAAGK
jgi:membrane dipeptidase